MRWAVAAAVSAWAAALIVRHTTPIDEALPFLVIVLTVIAAVTHPAIQLSVPLLLLGEITFPDESLRLLWFGVVVAISFATAMLWSGGAVARAGSEDRTRLAPLVITLAAVILLRWIPIEAVLYGREIFILGLAAATVLVLGSTPVAVVVAVGAALFTPAVPLRTLIVPMLVLVLAVIARAVGASRIQFPAAAATALALPMMFFAWSGAFSRALPVMLTGGPPRLVRVPVRIALAAGQSAEVDVPPGGRGVILSGANVPRLRRGAVLGTIEPGHIVVRIGDVADWGVLRRDHYYASRNPLPHRPGGLLRGYGQTAWIDASGRIAVSPGRLLVTAARDLPAGASLQIDAIEMAR
jgi:hypothetical protein